MLFSGESEGGGERREGREHISHSSWHPNVDYSSGYMTSWLCFWCTMFWWMRYLQSSGRSSADIEVAVTGEIHLLCLSQQYCGSWHSCDLIPLCTDHYYMCILLMSWIKLSICYWPCIHCTTCSTFNVLYCTFCSLKDNSTEHSGALQLAVAESLRINCSLQSLKYVRADFMCYSEDRIREGGRGGITFHILVFILFKFWPFGPGTWLYDCVLYILIS